MVDENDIKEIVEKIFKTNIDLFTKDGKTIPGGVIFGILFDLITLLHTLTGDDDIFDIIPKMCEEIKEKSKQQSYDPKVNSTRWQ